MNLSETDTVNFLQHSVENPRKSADRACNRAACALHGEDSHCIHCSLATFASALTPSFITATVDQRRTTIMLYAECQTDRCLFIIIISHTTRRSYDGSHRQPCRCISLASHEITFTLHSADSHYRHKNCVTDNLCTLSITLTTKVAVTAIIFAKVQIVHF